ncbi:MAG: glycoside hydrolase family 3 N-terminal domain-containing protein [Thermoanaerobaculia bacterium]|nr:glycoside hydrolase family 3 N-terminal domain-containing protein [Thermoanaerobaculia bacterium]
MRPRWKRRLFAVACLSCVTPLAADDLPQLGRDATKDVVAALTLEEKVGLVMGTGMRVFGLPPEFQPPRVDQADPIVPGAAGRTFAVPRLGIPAIVLADGPAGLRIAPRREGSDRTYHATAFPVATLLASSWDLDLVERVGRAMGGEARAYGVDVLLAPALNIHRNPLGGRNFEYYSEDPLLAGRMAAALVEGVQSRGVGTALKHFVANNHEWNRHVLDVQVGQRALREIYLRGFEIAVREARPWTIMSSYNRLNGVYTSERADLLTGVVRHDWGYDGLVMTDWFGGRDAVAQMEAGNELLMPGTERQRQALLEAVRNGELDERVLDRNVGRVLDLVQKTPSFLGYEPSLAPDSERHARLARQAASEGMVLLRNEAVLPLEAGTGIALFGNAAYQPFIGGTGSGEVHEAYSVSLVRGLREAGMRLDPALERAYAAYIAREEAARPRQVLPFLPVPPIPERPVPAEEIERLAREADLALLVIGRTSGEFVDRKREGDFELSAVERDLVAGLADCFHGRDKRLLVVLNIGGPIETVSWRDHADAILLAWQPGQEAGFAIADVLTGATPPSGKLATTFPVRWEDVPSSSNFPGTTLLGPDPTSPLAFLGDRAAELVYEDDIWVGYRHFATRGVEPAYPFGFGLSYTTFVYDELALSQETFDGAVEVRVTITNAGERPGREIVQLYLSVPGDEVPALELRDFAKTRTLPPGASETLSFTLTGRDLASFDPASSAWIAPAGTYTVRIGASSADIRQTASFELSETEQVGLVATAVD